MKSVDRRPTRSGPGPHQERQGGGDGESDCQYRRPVPAVEARGVDRLGIEEQLPHASRDGDVGLVRDCHARVLQHVRPLVAFIQGRFGAHGAIIDFEVELGVEVGPHHARDHLLDVIDREHKTAQRGAPPRHRRRRIVHRGKYQDHRHAGSAGDVVMPRSGARLAAVARLLHRRPALRNDREIEAFGLARAGVELVNVQVGIGEIGIHAGAAQRQFRVVSMAACAKWACGAARTERRRR